MNHHQECRLNMYLSIKDYLISKNDITDSLPDYTNNFTLLTNIIPQIQDISMQQKSSNKGITEHKNNLKEKIIIITVDYARKLYAYAKITNDSKLAQTTKISRSTLKSASDFAVKNFAQLIYNLSQPIIDSLAGYGITTETQTQLSDLIAAYDESIGKPRTCITERAQTTKQLTSLFKTAEMALDNIDVVIEILRFSHPIFYNGYKIARRVIDNSVRRLSVKGTVINSTNGKPIKGASIIFSMENQTNYSKSSIAKPTSEVILTKMTAEQGGFNIKSLPSGMYKVTVSKVGFANHEECIAVADGELTKLYFELLRN